ncbi:MAG: hypothetical protein ABI471_11060 [Sphingomonas bacterium]
MALLLLALQIMVMAPDVSGPPPVCRYQDGLIGRPVVPTAEVARGIFAAVAKPLQSEQAGSGYVLTIADQGAAWGISQALPAPTDGSTIRGGGGLTMRIDKCTGAISEMHYIR